MAVFNYVAVDQNGSTSNGSVEAESQEQALALLGQRGLMVSEISPSREAPSAGKAGAGAAKKKKKGKKGLNIEIGGGPNSEDISIFTRQMATLVQAGLPLLRSLEVMIKQQEKKPKFKEMLEKISEKVSSGGNLSDGLATYPKGGRRCLGARARSLVSISGKIHPHHQESKVRHDLPKRNYVCRGGDRHLVDDGGGSTI